MIVSTVRLALSLMRILSCLVLGFWSLQGEAQVLEPRWKEALSTDVEAGRLQLLQAASPLPLHASKTSKAARASLDFSGLATLEFEVEKIHDHRLKGQLLEQAAMQAAALAVAEETAAAHAAGGGEPARLLASSRMKHTRTEVAAESAKMHHFVERFEVINESSRTNTSAHGNASSASKSNQGVNPFNPFTNPFFNPFVPNPYTPMHTGGGGFRGGNLLLILFLVVLAVSFCAITFGGLMEDEDDSSGDDSSYGYLNRLDADGARRGRERMAKKLAPEDRKRTCTHCFSCFGFKCSSTVITFTLVAVFITVLGGKILWNAGILQPLLAQLLLYAYVILIIFGFVAVITHELTRKVRTMLRGIYQNLSDVTEVMPGFMRKKGNNSPRF